MATIDYLQRFPKSILNNETTSVLGKLWSLYATQIDEILDCITDLLNLLSIYDQNGLTLDEIIGSLVNQARIPGNNDDTYKLNLFIAIAKKISGGTIPELVDIGSAVAGEDENARFRPFELYSNTDDVFLDGADVLDASEPLSPSTYRTASVESLIEGNIDNITVPLEVGDAIDQIRGAGIYVKFRIKFLINESQATLYTTTYTTLDSTGALDGKTYMSGTDIKLAIDEIALGDGASGAPLPGDTGLNNEVYRATAETETQASGELSYKITIDASDLNSYTIDELACFESGGDMILKGVFTGKAKNASLIYEYIVVENL
jgi:hypothetical protein